MRFTIRQFMTITAVSIFVVILEYPIHEARLAPLPLVVLQAVKKKVPGIAVESVRQESFKQETRLGSGWHW